MRGNTHVRCGERGMETGRKKFRYRAMPRLSISVDGRTGAVYVVYGKHDEQPVQSSWNTEFRRCIFS